MVHSEFINKNQSANRTNPYALKVGEGWIYRYGIDFLLSPLRSGMDPAEAGDVSLAIWNPLHKFNHCFAVRGSSDRGPILFVQVGSEFRNSLP